ncbi:MAG: hypothetical protein K2X27_19535 [Candidatus Obscuribacterales bacterium]|nr:hypothetical protein [Candidatus Obscuribacterales bacterium]
MSRVLKNVLSLTLVLSASTIYSEVNAGSCSGHKGVSVELTVMAPPEIAFGMVKEMRQEDPSGCKVLSSNDTESLVEETFDGLPIIGKATCVYKETYSPISTVSFNLVRSDKLKAFEGEWTFDPIDDGQHTRVKLRSYIDTGLKIPFARQITDAASTCEVKEQIADLKKFAESKHQKMIAGKAKQST